jgi:hypothetical protein
MGTWGFNADYVLVSNAEPLEKSGMERRVEILRKSLGAGGRAHGNPGRIAAHVRVAAPTEDEARIKAAEVLHAGLDDGGLRGIFRTERGPDCTGTE